MYQKRKPSKNRRKQREDRIHKLSLQLVCCLLILSVSRGMEFLPEGRVQEGLTRVFQYGASDRDPKEAVTAAGSAIRSLYETESEPRMSWPCNEIETMALAADTSSKTYSFSSEKEEMQVYATRGGTVKEILDGRILISHGNGLETVYDGCTDVYVRTLQKVRKGELIASIAKGEQQSPQLRFQILKEQQPVDIGEYLYED